MLCPRATDWGTCDCGRIVDVEDAVDDVFTVFREDEREDWRVG